MGITLFELATQNGIITNHMGQYLKRQIHTYDIPVVNGRRTYRVYLGERDNPIFEYVIPDRSPIETQQMWAYKVKAELDKAWKESQHPPAPKLEAGAVIAPPPPEPPKVTPAPAMLIVDEAAEVDPAVYEKVPAVKSTPKKTKKKAKA